ncbi:MAG: RING finger domain-containing protein [Candidatus Odinarchaeota archaeon]
MTQLAGRFEISSVKEIGRWDWTASAKCIVCGLLIRDGQQMVYCPSCGNPAHYAHLAEWVKVKGTCPICRKRVNLRKLKPVRK